MLKFPFSEYRLLSVFLLVFMSHFSLIVAQNEPIALQIDKAIDKAWELSMSNNDSALIIAQQALELSQDSQYYLGQILAMESIGLYHEMITGNIEQASDHYFKAIELCETHQLAYISSLYHTLGVMFHTTDNYEKAKQYYLLSLEKATGQGDSLLIKKCLINLGSVHSSLNDFDSAERFMKESLAIEVTHEMDYTTYANLGYLYVKQEKFGQAIHMLIKATEENPENPDPDLNLYFLLHAKTMARDSSQMKHALSRARKAAESDQYGLRDQSLLLRNIADYLAFTGNYKEALAYRDRYIQVFEEIKEKQRDRIVLDLESKYETAKKDAQLKVLQLETEKKAQQTRFYAILALLGLLISGLIGYFLFKNTEKNKLLTSQKQQLEENVEEIKLLLREIHHRVKNNLQVITSLLNIQERSISDVKAIEAIKESKNRIKSMGLIHQSFYENRNLGRINTRDYIQNLVNQLLENYKTDKKRIELETRVEDIFMDMDTLVPLGLIINEMVSNTLKHAFEQKENGKLTISLENSNDKYHLIISDNGSGLNDLTELKKSKSFGFSMIEAFVKKLRGTLQLLDTEGTTFQIEFHA
jgi:two-component sensor histidine kinase